MDEIVATPDEVTTINLATRKRRFFAFLIDSLIIVLFGKLLGLLFGDFFIELGDLGKIVGFIVVLFYFGIGNSKILNGQTVAKKLLKIRVVGKSSEAISVQKSFLRTIPFAAYILLNGLPVSDSADLYPSLILGTILFSIPVLETYFIIVNNKSLQSLHDMIAKTFVVSVKSEGNINIANQKVFLYVGIALPILILIVTIVGSATVSNKLIYVTDMQKIISVASHELPISSISMYRNKTTTTNLNGETTQVKLIEVTATKINKDENDTLLAIKIAKVIFDSGFKFEDGETLSITIIYGYDIGIASNYFSNKFNDSIENWKKVIPFADLVGKQTQEKPKVDEEYEFLWRAVARSQHIVSGVLHVDTNKINEIKQKATERIEINFVIDSVYKGDISAKEIVIRKTICAGQETGIHCYDSSLFKYNNQKIIAPINESASDTNKYAFTGSNAKSILLETEENKAKIISEIAKQKDIIENKQYSSVCKIAQHFTEVKAIIEDMLIDSTAKRAYESLEKLGKSSAAAMICLMDDRRELAVPLITLEYPPASKNVKQYTPKQVVDVLATFLRQFAGNDFGYIYNGASEKQRANTVNGWRIFLWRIAH